MKALHAALLLLLSIITVSFGDTAAETAFLKSLVTPALGTTPDDWIALLGKPIKTYAPHVDEKHPTINDKELEFVFDRGDVWIRAFFFDGIVNRVLFGAWGQKINRTGFAWDESKIWTVLEQYDIRRFALQSLQDLQKLYPGLQESKLYPGMKQGTHGDFEIFWTPPSLASNRNSDKDFGTLEIRSRSLENAEMEARQRFASSLIPSDLTEQFDIVINNPVRENSNWLVNGTVKNNSSVEVKRYSIKIWLYTFDDKHRLWGTFYGGLNDSSNILKPGEEHAVQWIFGDKDNIVKSFGTGLEFDPYTMMPAN
jgi:hypothetical protein